MPVHLSLKCFWPAVWTEEYRLGSNHIDQVTVFGGIPASPSQDLENQNVAENTQIRVANSITCMFLLSLFLPAVPFHRASICSGFLYYSLLIASTVHGFHFTSPLLPSSFLPPLVRPSPVLAGSVTTPLAGVSTFWISLAS